MKELLLIVLLAQQENILIQRTSFALIVQVVAQHANHLIHVYHAKQDIINQDTHAQNADLIAKNAVHTVLATNVKKVTILLQQVLVLNA